MRYDLYRLHARSDFSFCYINFWILHAIFSFNGADVLLQIASIHWSDFRSICSTSASRTVQASEC